MYYFYHGLESKNNNAIKKDPREKALTKKLKHRNNFICTQLTTEHEKNRHRSFKSSKK